MKIKYDSPEEAFEDGRKDAINGFKNYVQKKRVDANLYKNRAERKRMLEDADMVEKLILMVFGES